MKASSLTIYDETNLATPTNSYLTFSTNTITVNAASASIQPGFRILRVLAVVQGF